MTPEAFRRVLEDIFKMTITIVDAGTAFKCQDKDRVIIIDNINDISATHQCFIIDELLKFKKGN